MDFGLNLDNSAFMNDYLARVTQIKKAERSDSLMSNLSGFLYTQPRRSLSVPQTQLPSIKRVIFNAPATIVYWSDDSKTVVKCGEGDTYNAETGLAMCISKKYFGNKGNFNDEFKKWLKEDKEDKVGKL